MPTQRYTLAARQRDERIYQLLLSGFPPNYVVKVWGISEREVFTAELRLETQWRRGGENEVARQRLIMCCGIIAAESMRAWQQSRLPDAGDDDADVTVPMGDARHLDRALRAFALQAKQIGPPAKADDEPTPEAPPEQQEPAASAESAAETQAESASELSPRNGAPNSHGKPLPASLFASSPPGPRPGAPAIPKSVLDDVCSRAVANGFAPRKAK